MDNLTKAGVIAVLIVVMPAFFLSACAGPAVVKAANNSPVIENVLYPKDTFSTMEVQVQCVAADKDGDNLTYQWIAGSGQIKGEGPVVMWFPPEKLGTYPVTVSVADGKGGEAKQTVEIRVVTNADGTATPTIDVKLKLGEAQAVIVDKQRARIWMTTEIVCMVENAGDKQLIYSWSIDGGKMMGKGIEEGRADRIGWIAPGTAGNYLIAVVATDNNGGQAKGQVNMQVFCCGN